MKLKEALLCSKHIQVFNWMKFDAISKDLLYLQGDENEDDNIDSQNSDHDSSSQKNIVNNQCKGKACKYLFNLTLVNSYGSTDIQALQDNGKPLKQLTGTITTHGCNPAVIQRHRYNWGSPLAILTIFFWRKLNFYFLVFVLVNKHCPEFFFIIFFASFFCVIFLRHLNRQVLLWQFIHIFQGICIHKQMTHTCITSIHWCSSFFIIPYFVKIYVISYCISFYTLNSRII